MKFKELFTERIQKMKIKAKISSLEAEIKYMEKSGEDASIIKVMKKQLEVLKKSPALNENKFQSNYELDRKLVI